MVKKRSVVGILLISTFLLSVPMAHAAPIKIRYAHWGANPWIDAIVKGFNKSQNKYQIQYEKPGDFRSVILTSMAGGSPPTIFSTGWWIGLGSWMKKGLLLDMNPYIKQEKAFNINDIPDFLREAGQYGGHTYAFPFEDIGANCVWINNTLFKKAGLAKPQDNWTVQDFIEYALKLTKDNNGDGKKDQYALDNISGWYETRVTSMVLGGGGLYFSNDRKEWIGDNAKNVKGLETIYDLIHKYRVTSPNGLGLASGKQAMMIRDACQTDPVNSVKGKYDFDVAAPPAIDGSGKRYPQDMQGTFLSIARNSKKKEVEGAWAFIKYWTGEEGVKAARSTVGWLQRPPARRSLAVKYFTKPENKIFSTIDLANFVKWESTATTSENWPIENFDKINEVLQNEWYNAYSGKVSVNQFLGTVSPKVRQLLKGK